MKSETVPDSRRLVKLAPGRFEDATVYDPALVADAEEGEKDLGQCEVYGEVRM